MKYSKFSVCVCSDAGTWDYNSPQHQKNAGTWDYDSPQILGRTGTWDYDSPRLLGVRELGIMIPPVSYHKHIGYLGLVMLEVKIN